MAKRDYGKNLGKFLHAKGAKAPSPPKSTGARNNPTRKTVRQIHNDIKKGY
jgi:hypothetical protein